MQTLARLTGVQAVPSPRRRTFEDILGQHSDRMRSASPPRKNKQKRDFFFGEEKEKEYTRGAFQAHGGMRKLKVDKDGKGRFLGGLKESVKKALAGK